MAPSFQRCILILSTLSIIAKCYTLQCSTSSPCPDIINCPAGQDCNIICTTAGCNFKTINCPSTSNTCSVQCGSTTQIPCESITIDASNTDGGNLIVIAEEIQHGMSNAIILCPSNASCDLICNQRACDTGVQINGTTGTKLTVNATTSSSFYDGQVKCGDNGSCNLNCNGQDSCRNVIIDARATSSTNVQLITQGTNSFYMGKVYGSAYGDMNVICNERDACRESLISADAASTSLTISAEANYNVLYGATIYCPNNGATKDIICNINCIAAGCMQQASIYAVESFRDVYVHCSKAVGTPCHNSNEIGSLTMYCKTDYSSSCIMQLNSNTYDQMHCDPANELCETYELQTETPTTKAPTTKGPTNAATTKTPTTKTPTTKTPTTNAPTTKGPTTKSPTKGPTTNAPTTKGPTTKGPTTNAPTTTAPTNNSITSSTNHPTPAPTSNPTAAPTMDPSKQPTDRPSKPTTSNSSQSSTYIPTQIGTEKSEEITKSTEEITESTEEHIESTQLTPIIMDKFPFTFTEILLTVIAMCCLCILCILLIKCKRNKSTDSTAIDAIFKNSKENVNIEGNVNNDHEQRGADVGEIELNQPRLSLKDRLSLKSNSLNKRKKPMDASDSYELMYVKHKNESAGNLHDHPPLPPAKEEVDVSDPPNNNAIIEGVYSDDDAKSDDSDAAIDDNAKGDYNEKILLESNSNLTMVGGPIEIRYASPSPSGPTPSDLSEQYTANGDV